MKYLAVLALTVAMGGTALAQTAKPYAGLQNRFIKALSDEKMADLRAGRGMGYAIAAELNGYPGPAHVLELSDKLELSDAQRVRIQALWTQMQSEAVPLGSRLIDQESALDRLFATHTVSADNLATSTQGIAATDAALRATHLKFHLSTREILTPAQVQRYSELRGYGDGTAPPQHSHQRQH